MMALYYEQWQKALPKCPLIQILSSLLAIKRQLQKLATLEATDSILILVARADAIIQVAYCETGRSVSTPLIRTFRY